MVLESQQHLRPWMPWADQYDGDRAAEYLGQCQAQWESGDAFSYAIALGLPGIDRVEIHHDVANVASGRIPAKLGYTRLGERPTRDLWPPAPSDTGTDVIWQATR